MAELTNIGAQANATIKLTRDWYYAVKVKQIDSVVPDLNTYTLTAKIVDVQGVLKVTATVTVDTLDSTKCLVVYSDTNLLASLQQGGTYKHFLLATKAGRESELLQGKVSVQ